MSNTCRPYDHRLWEACNLADVAVSIGKTQCFKSSCLLHVNQQLQSWHILNAMYDMLKAVCFGDLQWAVCQLGGMQLAVHWHLSR